MCACNPMVKTPWCGKPGCEAPPQPPRAALVELVSGPGRQTIRLDGVDIAACVRRIAIDAGAGKLPDVTMDLIAKDGVDITVSATVTLYMQPPEGCTIVQEPQPDGSTRWRVELAS